MEIWVEASGFPSHEVSSRGRIRNKKNGHVLKQSLDRYGYPRLSIGNKDNVYVHRLVCETFYGPSEGLKKHVNHIDSNRQNNHVLNLEWCTPSENIKWGVKKGRINPNIGVDRAIKVNRRPVRIIELDKIFSSVKDCAEFLGVPPTNVSRCLVGKRAGQKIHGYRVEHVRKG